MKAHVQAVQNIYGKGGSGVSKAKLRPPEVDPYFERKKITLGGVAKSWGVTILTLEQNPPERIFLTFIKIFSQEDFALQSKLWPANFWEHLFCFVFSLEIRVNFGRP